MKNLTIIGPRSIGKSAVCKKIEVQRKLKYFELDKILDKSLKKHGGLISALKLKKVNEALNNEAPRKILKILNKKNVLLELGGSAISSDNKKTNKKNLKTILENSVVIPLIYSKNIRESTNLLYLHGKEPYRENIGENKNKVKSKYIKFLDSINTNNLEPIYCKNKTIEEISKEVLRRFNFNNKFKLIIFDQDGTFYQKDGKLTRILRNKTKEWIIQRLNKSIKEVNRLYPNLQKKYPNALEGFNSLGLTIKDYHQSVFDKVNPSGIMAKDKRLISFLKKINSKKIVVTFSSKKYSKKLQKVLGIEDLIDRTYSLSQFSPITSKYKVYEYIRKGNNLKKEEICIIGDNFKVDIYEASKKGYNSILISKKGTNKIRKVSKIHDLIH